MAEYTAPLRDMQFVIEELIGLEDVAALPGFEDATSDTVNAILDEANKMARDVLSPINRGGDLEGSRLENGVVITPTGFKEAYKAYADGGWNSLQFDTEIGGQGLPMLVATPVFEMWDAANLAFMLCPVLTIAGVVQLQRGKLELAENLLSMANKLAPDYADAIYNLGFILERKGDLPGAISLYRDTLACQPKHLPAMFNLGNVLKARGDLVAAESCYRQILEVGPHPQALKNLGILALDDDRHIDAEEYFRAGLALAEDPDIEAYLGFTLLAQERFAEGWQYYEARLTAKSPKMLPALADKPLWDFKAAGKLLVWTEEGIGDVVMFASVLNHILDHCTRVLLVADPRLHALFSRSFSSNLSLYGAYSDVPIDVVDAQVALASCIGPYRKAGDQFSAFSGDYYLKADERRVAELKPKLAELAH